MPGFDGLNAIDVLEVKKYGGGLWDFLMINACIPSRCRVFLRAQRDLSV